MASHIPRLIKTFKTCLKIGLLIFFGMNAFAGTAQSETDSTQQSITPKIMSKLFMPLHQVERRYLNLLSLSKTIRVSVIVNEDHYLVQDNEIELTINKASDLLMEKTGSSFLLHRIQHGHYGDNTPEQIFQSYLIHRLTDLPDYVVVLTKKNTRTNGGYTLVPPFGERAIEFQALLQGPVINCNAAGSPYHSPGVVYGAAIDWDHIIGSCGYEVNNDEYIHVSNTSINGECRNTPGLQCVYYNGHWRCPNLITDPVLGPFIEDNSLWVGWTIAHELLHNFGHKVNSDHVCSDDVTDALKAKSALNMCGEVIDTFQKATQKCMDEPRPIGSTCQHKDHCDNSYCYSFGFQSHESFYCSVACNDVSNCPVRLGKTVQCRDRYENNPVAGKACFYTPAFE